MTREQPPLKKGAIMGTPRKYDPKRHPLIAQGMAIQGATAAEIAAALGVGERTVTTWMTSHEEFAEAVTLGRERADARVLSSLYQKALGGDTTACIFWLKNRQPREWRDRQEIRQEASVTVTSNENSASAEKLGAAIASREKAARERMASGDVPDTDQLDRMPLIDQCVWHAVIHNLEPEQVIAYVYQERETEKHYAEKFGGLH